MVLASVEDTAETMHTNAISQRERADEKRNHKWKVLKGVKRRRQPSRMTKAAIFLPDPQEVTGRKCGWK